MSQSPSPIGSAAKTIPVAQLRQRNCAQVVTQHAADGRLPVGRQPRQMIPLAISSPVVGSHATSDRPASLIEITDAAANGLGVADLLAEMLDRIRVILETDIAAVLLLEESGEDLVAHTSRGLEEKTREHRGSTPPRRSQNHAGLDCETSWGADGFCRHDSHCRMHV